MTRLLRPLFGAFLAIALLLTPAASAVSSPVGQAESPSQRPEEASGPPAAALSAEAAPAAAAVEVAELPALPAPAVAAPASRVAGPAPTIALADGEEVLHFAELPNFHRVDTNLYRGGQPGPRGFARLNSVGVRTVLNLRYERPQIAAEGKAAMAAGLRYFSVPMYGLLRPTNQQIADALKIIHDPENWPVFVHCVRGADRTGAVVACYRIEQTKWTAEKAIQEAMALGMLWIEVPKRSYIRDFAKLGG